MTDPPAHDEPMARSSSDRRFRSYWDRQAEGYDRCVAFSERYLFAGTRPWLCQQARGQTLEVAVGTGLNLPHYPRDVQLTGVEWSPRMLRLAQRRADGLGREVDFRVGDAQRLPLPDARFDTVVCTFALCCIPDDRRALAEMSRVLRPGGLLLLADHVRSTAWPVRVLQAAADAVSVPRHGEHYRRRPLPQVEALGYTIERHDRFALGLIERLAARRPQTVAHSAGP
jgi:ubiquinone/menaquinone biosynthesis C-methylase UbiE